ncbi:MAG: hypothetical protein IKT26_07205, partial [Bacteroidaceae bacterium]|nr:hypothetical protein [Bacteroidaceae bacterium]
GCGSGKQKENFFFLLFSSRLAHLADAQSRLRLGKTKRKLLFPFVLLSPCTTFVPRKVHKDKNSTSDD